MYTDDLLKAGSKASPKDLAKMVDDVIVLLRVIEGKDIFQAFFKKLLGKRLLLGKSESRDGEMLMIAKLKEECGSSFTRKLEEMFKDVDLSADLGGQYLAVSSSSCC